MGEEIRRILRVYNTSAIFVTHDQTDALSLSDRIAVMALRNGEGYIAQYDAPEVVYSNPSCKTGGSSYRNGLVSRWEGDG